MLTTSTQPQPSGSPQFFHWHVAFPHTFRLHAKGETPENEAMGWNGGFDVVLGNPPWERVKLQEKEFFAARSPDIAGARTATERKKRIAALPTTDPGLHQAYRAALRESEAVSSFLRTSGRYPLSAVGDVNTYQVFAGLARKIVDGRGRAGIVVPTGIATDYYNRDYFTAVVNGQELVSLYDFENREGLFPGVHRSYKFILLTLTGPGSEMEAADFAFYLHRTDQLRDPERHFALTLDDLARINPNTRTCPVFRTRRDADLARVIYNRVPVLISDLSDENGRKIAERNPWRITLFTMLHSSGAAHLFRDISMLLEIAHRELNFWWAGEKRYLPLYEGKMFHQFDHRFASVVVTQNLARPAQPIESSLDEHKDPSWLPETRAWVGEAEVDINSPDGVSTNWFLVFRAVTSSTNERTLLATILPRVAIVDSVNIVGFSQDSEAWQACALLANFNSFVLDYVVRQKVGGVHIKFYLLQQLPVLPPDRYTPEWLTFIVPCVLELTYTAWDLEPFARDCGYDGPPFRWDEERRFLLRCELDAAYFHLYGIARDDVDYIMETFPIVKRKDDAAHGEYRTKRVILKIYDAMQRAMEAGEPYQTLLDPSPADPRVAHPPREE